jgi:putative ABC transport system permease protein
MLQDLLQDLRYGFRGLLRNPLFTLMAMLTLALGLGANVAIFTVVDAVLLKPLPYSEPEKLVQVFEKPPGGQRNAVSALNFLDWRENSKNLSLVASTGNWLTMTGQGEPQRVQARLVSPDYFDVITSRPATGRPFRPEEGTLGNEHILLVTHRFWQERLGLDPHVLGRTLTLDGLPYTVIGTLPADSWTERHFADVWMPLAITHFNSSRDFRSLSVYGRLRPGATLAAAQAEMDAIGARLAADYPATDKAFGVTVDPLVDRIVGQQLRQTLFVLFAAVGAVLLIACVNLANLLLARSASRERELWVRVSLGAGRLRLMRQLLTESVLLSLAGGVAGWGLGVVLLKGLVAMMPPSTLPLQADVKLDLGVLAFLFALAVGSGLLFGLAPAIAACRRDVAEGLKEGNRGSSGGVSGRRVRAALIATEVALTFVLVATAGVLIHSFARLTGVDTGVEMTNVVTMNLPRAMQRDTDPVREAALMNQIRDSVAALPGIRDAAVTSAPPMQGWGFGLPFQIQGRSGAADGGRSGLGFKIVTASYFSTLGMKMKEGRSLAETDVANAPRVIVINETMAKRYFKNDDPIGQHLMLQTIVTGKRELGPAVPWEIVGVVSDERTNNLDGDPSPGGYVTFDQSPIVGVGLVVRAQSPPMSMKKAIQAAIWSVHKDQAITDFKLLEEIKSESGAQARFYTLLLTGFSAMGLLLAAVGIYGVVAYSVAQRTRELGIRAALGASKSHLLRSALRSSLLATAIGLAAGAIAIRWSGRLVASMLFNTKPAEPETLVTVASVLVLVALTASLIPARRAAKIDPVIALRQE